MMLASLIVPQPAWFAYAAGAFLLAWGIAAWGYRGIPPGPVRRFGLGLRTLALLLVAFCLLEPLRTGQRARPGANLIAVVADNSQGLQVRDARGGATRGEQLRELVTSDPGGWQAALEEQFEVRRFLFDSRLHASRDFSELDFEGRATAIGGALRDLSTRFAGRPLAGILLLTDGNATDLRNTLPDIPGLPPVHPVLLGRPGEVTDMALTRVQVSQTDFEDAPVSVQADVTATGFRAESFTARLRDRTGRVVQEQTVTVRGDDEQRTLNFRWRPAQPGLSFYQLEVGAAGDVSTNTAAAGPREATLLNNRRILAVNRGRGPYRILYVAGRPNWEYKFLHRALQADDQVQLVALIRVALREPKFEFRGRAGESGNPLFRGFGEQSREEVERYDQPILTRLNTRDELELRAGFPRVAEDLFGYHAVILDDVEYGFFAPDQAAVLQRFVSERGGGLFMLGGMESFHHGDYYRTPIGEMLPVYLDRPGTPPDLRDGLRFQLAREGWLQPWARLHDNETDERARLEAMPPFLVFNPVRDVKPGASVLATVTDRKGTEHPALVTQRFGRGRTAALLVGDLWRWGMRSPEARQEMDKAWRQMIRWLVADVPQRIEVTVEPATEGPGGAVQIQARVRDPQFQPVDDAEVSLSIQPVLAEVTGEATNTLRLRAEPSLAEPGLYETTFAPRHTGGYQVTATATNSAQADLGQAEAGWSTDLAADEFRSLQPNRPLLETIARRTGGEMLTPDQLPAFIRNLPSRQAPVMEAWTSPAWHTPWLFALALVCLIAEWGLRRRRGYP